MKNVDPRLHSPPWVFDLKCSITGEGGRLPITREESPMTVPLTGAAPSRSPLPAGYPRRPLQDITAVLYPDAGADRPSNIPPPSLIDRWRPRDWAEKERKGKPGGNLKGATEAPCARAWTSPAPAQHEGPAFPILPDSPGAAEPLPCMPSTREGAPTCEAAASKAAASTHSVGGRRGGEGAAEQSRQLRESASSKAKRKGLRC
eukprot:TRINITY_DN26593_c0_g1_i1.p1 TRINITY_DN26593_c0_g1~~TRINITY_DN26593_c0_g1_i1.p1  ORF type:complete len:203 (+),score=22.71 TRINITY_DN26593_c0_g1_i1:141-749(+)